MPINSLFGAIVCLSKHKHAPHARPHLTETSRAATGTDSTEIIEDADGPLSLLLRIFVRLASKKRELSEKVLSDFIKFL
jgi:hypothetical protein